MPAPKVATVPQQILLNCHIPLGVYKHTCQSAEVHTMCDIAGFGTVHPLSLGVYVSGRRICNHCPSRIQSGYGLMLHGKPRLPGPGPRGCQVSCTAQHHSAALGQRPRVVAIPLLLHFFTRSCTLTDGGSEGSSVARLDNIERSHYSGWCVNDLDV